MTTKDEMLDQTGDGDYHHPNDDEMGRCQRINLGGQARAEAQLNAAIYREANDPDTIKRNIMMPHIERQCLTGEIPPLWVEQMLYTPQRLQEIQARRRWQGMRMIEQGQALAGIRPQTGLPGWVWALVVMLLVGMAFGGIVFVAGMMR